MNRRNKKAKEFTSNPTNEVVDLPKFEAKEFTPYIDGANYIIMQGR
jgi:hypothetical protein